MQKLSLFLLLTLTLWANALTPYIESLIEKETSQKYNKLLAILFEEESTFFEEEGNRSSVNIIKVTKTLKENGLLTLFYPKPLTIKSSFTFDAYPQNSIKIFFDLLRNLGYQFILTSSLKYEQTHYTWEISYTSRSIIDPLLLAKSLQEYNIHIRTIKRQNNHWHYFLDNRAMLLKDAIAIEHNGEPLTLREQNQNYWLSLEDNRSQTLSIKSRYPNIWYPHIVCYNGTFNILKTIIRDKKTKQYRLSLPKGAKYIRIRDRYTNDNLKHGITVKAH